MRPERPDLAVFMATSGHSGVDRLAANLLPGIAARGYQVDLLRIHHHGPQIEATQPGLHIHQLSARHVDTAFLSLVTYLRDRKPRALLTDKDRVNRIALIATRFARPRPRIYVRLGSTVSAKLGDRSRHERILQSISMRRLYPLADGILFPSQGAASDFLRFADTPVSRIRVVPSPLVPEDLAAKASAPTGHPWLDRPSVPVVLGAGELSARKDFATLLRAFALLRARRPARLVIIGEGNQRKSLQSLAGDLDVAHAVDFPGFVANPHAFMANAAILALSSRNEGFANVLAEAMAVGTPVVATDCPSGPREILADGRLGILVPVGDPLALADALEQTLRAPLPRERLQAAAGRYAVAASVDAYLSALGLRPAAPGNQ